MLMVVLISDRSDLHLGGLHQVSVPHDCALKETVDVGTETGLIPPPGLVLHGTVNDEVIVVVMVKCGETHSILIHQPISCKFTARLQVRSDAAAEKKTRTAA